MAALAAFVDLVLRGAVNFRLGVIVLLGERERGRPRPRGVGGGRIELLSFAVKVNFGGGEIAFFWSVGPFSILSGSNKA